MYRITKVSRISFSAASEFSSCCMIIIIVVVNMTLMGRQYSFDIVGLVHLPGIANASGLRWRIERG